MADLEKFQARMTFQTHMLVHRRTAFTNLHGANGYTLPERQKHACKVNVYDESR